MEINNAYPNSDSIVMDGVLARNDEMTGDVSFAVGGFLEEIKKRDRQIKRLEEHIKTHRSCIVGFCWYSYADLDGNIDWPNNKEGDLIKAMYINAIDKSIEELKEGG